MITGCSDARIFSKLGICTYGFTPMKLPESMSFNRTIHVTDERITLESLEFGTKAIFRAMQRYNK